MLLAQVAIADREDIQFDTHEAPKGVFRRADDGLALHVEPGIDQDLAACLLLELGEARVESEIGIPFPGPRPVRECYSALG